MPAELKHLLIIAPLLAFQGFAALAFQNEVKLVNSEFPSDHPIHQSMLSGLQAEGVDVKAVKSAIKNSSVRIRSYSGGSGVIVDKRAGGIYTVLTCWHVVKDLLSDEQVSIATHDSGLHISSGSPRQIPGTDLALLEFVSSNAYLPISIAEVAPSAKDIVFVAGFPLSGKDSIRVSSGFIYDSNYLGGANGYSILHTAVTEPGMSGGMVVDKNGQLIAIHGAGEQDIRSKTELVKSGVNKAIPARWYSGSVAIKGSSAVISEPDSISTSNTIDDLFLAIQALDLNMANARQIIALSQRLVQLSPARSYWKRFAYSQLDGAYYFLGDHKLASYYSGLYAEHSSENDGDEFLAVFQTVRSLYLKGDNKAAIALMLQNEKKYPSSGDFYAQLAYVYMLDRDIANSRIAHDKAIALRPDDEALKMQKVYLYHLERDYITYDIELARFVSDHPSSYKGLAELARRQAINGFDVLATNNCAKAIDLAPPRSDQKAEVLSTCAMAAWESDNHELAVLLASGSLSLMPSEASTIGLRGEIYKEMGRKEEACVDFRRASLLADSLSAELYEGYCQS